LSSIFNVTVDEHNNVFLSLVLRDSGFRHGVAESFSRLGCYGEYVDSWILTFRYELSISLSKVKLFDPWRWGF